MNKHTKSLLYFYRLKEIQSRKFFKKFIAIPFFSFSIYIISQFDIIFKIRSGIIFQIPPLWRNRKESNFHS